MSAKRSRRKSKPKAGEPPLLLAFSSQQAPENPEPAAPPEPAESGAGLGPGPASDETPGSDETFATLLRAVQSTELAASLQGAAPGGTQFGNSAPVEPLQCAETVTAFAPSPADPPPTKPPASHETLTSLLCSVQGKEFVERLHELTPIEALPRKPLPAKPPRSEAPRRTLTMPVVRPARAMRQVLAASPAASAPEAAPGRPLAPASAPQAQPITVKWVSGSAPPKPPASSDNRSLAVPFVARLKEEIGRFAPKVGVTKALKVHVEQRLSTGPQPQHSPDQRHSRRLLKPPLVCFYWTGGPPQPHPVADISSGGLYLLTNDRWYPGSMVAMTLQRTDQAHKIKESWISVVFMVVRAGNDGLGGAFVPYTPELACGTPGGAENCADKRTLKRFLKRLTASARMQENRAEDFR